jgi:glycine cleavage system H lipoate-binding protein
MTPVLVACTFLTSVLANLKNKNNKSGEITAQEVREAGLKELFEELNKNRKQCRYNFNPKLKMQKICENEFDCTGCFIHREYRYKFSKFGETYKELNISGFKFEPNKFYHRGHLTVSIEQCGIVTIGFSPLLAELLTNAQPTEPLRKNDIVEQNEVLTIFNNVHGVEIPLLSPLSGEIIAINQESDNNRLWLCAIKPFDLRKELQNLMFGEEAANWFDFETQEFVSLVTQQNIFAADGGEINIKNISSLPWKEIVFNFLMSGF